jgi:prepilin-type N-terminal cleavage/methylation domain-containing protein
MLRAPARRRWAAADGFTLVELLVAILIVGILVAIGLASFLHQRSKAEDAEAKVYAITAAKAMVIWDGDHGGYGGATAATLGRIEPSLDTARGLTVSGDADTFSVSVDSTAGTDGGGRYTVTRAADGTLQRTCEHPGMGGCAATPDENHNSW